MGPQDEYPEIDWPRFGKAVDACGVVLMVAILVFG